MRKYWNADGGGVAFYILEDNIYTIRNDLVRNNLELLAIEIVKPQSRPIIVLTSYDHRDSLTEYFCLIFFCWH